MATLLCIGERSACSGTPRVVNVCSRAPGRGQGQGQSQDQGRGRGQGRGQHLLGIYAAYAHQPLRPRTVARRTATPPRRMDRGTVQAPVHTVGGGTRLSVRGVSICTRRPSAMLLSARLRSLHVRTHFRGRMRTCARTRGLTSPSLPQRRSANATSNGTTNTLRSSTASSSYLALATEKAAQCVRRLERVEGLQHAGLQVGSIGLQVGPIGLQAGPIGL